MDGEIYIYLPVSTIVCLENNQILSDINHDKTSRGYFSLCGKAFEVDGRADIVVFLHIHFCICERKFPNCRFSFRHFGVLKNSAIRDFVNRAAEKHVASWERILKMKNLRLGLLITFIAWDGGRLIFLPQSIVSGKILASARARLDLSWIKFHNL